MSNFLTRLLAYAALLLLQACENPFFDKEPNASPQAVFESLYTTIDRKYSFFTYKHIDWQAIRAKHQQQIRPDMSQEALFQVMATMLDSLRDGHVNLTSRTNTSTYLGITRDKDKDGYFTIFKPSFYDDRVLLEHYFVQKDAQDERLQQAKGFGHKIFSRHGKKYGYIRYTSFSRVLDDQAIDLVLERMKQAQVSGLVFDLRENGGGSLSNAFRWASRFINRAEVTALGQVVKSGPGPNDFTAPNGYVIKRSGVQQFTQPIAVITNRSCYSASSFFTAMLYAPGFEHIRLIGDNTGGGSGLPVDQQLPNGWSYRFSATRAFSPYIRGKDIVADFRQFTGADGKQLTHLPYGFDFEAGVPVDLPIHASTFDAYAEKNKDYAIESAFWLMDNIPLQRWSTFTIEELWREGKAIRSSTGTYFNADVLGIQ